MPSQDYDGRQTSPSAVAADSLHLFNNRGPGRPELPLSVSASTSGVPAPVLRRFNGFLRLKDPVDLAGVELGAFGLNLLIPLTRQSHSTQVDRFCSDMYVRVFQAMRERVLGQVDAEVADFEDLKVPKEGPRRQIRATLSTARKSRVTTLFRCYHNDSFVYVAADSYLLGPLNWFAVLVRVAVLLVVLALALTNPVLGLIAAVVAFGLLFSRAIRGVRMYGLDVGLRAAYPKLARDSSFDRDDCMMFLKGIMPATVRAIRDSAKANDIDVTALEGPLANLEVGYSITNSFSGNVYANAAGGVMNVEGTMGNVVAGIRNVVNESGQPK